MENTSDGSPTRCNRRRYEIASQLAGTCPAHLGREIAVTGSVSAGIADDLSDIEVNLWNEQLPSIDQWRSWLEGMGATDISPDIKDNSFDDSRWVTRRYGDVWIELGWGTVALFDDLIRSIASGTR